MIRLVCPSQPFLRSKTSIHFAIAGASPHQVPTGFATPVTPLPLPRLILCCSRKGAGDKKLPALISLVTPKPKIICIHCKKKMTKYDAGFESYKKLKKHFKKKFKYEKNKLHHCAVWCPECRNGLKRSAMYYLKDKNGNFIDKEGNIVQAHDHEKKVKMFKNHGCPQTVRKRKEWEKAEKELLEKKAMGKKKAKGKKKAMGKKKENRGN